MIARFLTTNALPLGLLAVALIFARGLAWIAMEIPNG